jgi:AraC-like DNA-binding protein
MKIYDSNHVKYHWHDEYEFLIAKHDGTVCSVGGKQITLNKGDSLMIEGGELHSLSLEAGKSVTAIVVHPTFWACDEYDLFEKLKFETVFRAHDEIGAKITELLTDATECCLRKPFGYEFLLKSYFGNIFAILLSHGRYKGKTVHNNAASSPEMMLFEHVHSHLNEDISLDALCELSHFSKSYVIRIFKKHTGQTPTEYINRCRIEQAKELLTSKCVTDTALDCGFNNVSYFIRTFKRYTGVTPREWKSQN